MRNNFKNRFKATILTFSSLFISKVYIKKKWSLCSIQFLISIINTVLCPTLSLSVERHTYNEAPSFFSGLHYKHNTERKLLNHHPLP